MKTIIKSLFFTLFAVVTFACSDDNDKQNIDDAIFPYTICVSVVDADGDNLVANGEFDKNYPNAKITFQNQEIPYDGKLDYSEDKYFENDKEYYFFYRYDLCYDLEKFYPCLRFGSFFKAQDNSFILDWGDGTKDKVRFVVNYYPNSYKVNECSVYLNDVKANCQLFDNNVILQIKK